MINIKEALTLEGLKYFYTQHIKPLKTRLSQLGTAANCSVVNNATTTVANTVLDGRMGKTLADKDANLQSQISSLNSALANAFKIKTYTIQLTSNNYVAPFSYYASVGISQSDISKYGIPIIASATGEAGNAIPVSLYDNGTGVYSYSVVSSDVNANIRVTFFKV